MKTRYRNNGLRMLAFSAGLVAAFYSPSPLASIEQTLDELPLSLKDELKSAAPIPGPFIGAPWAESVERYWFYDKRSEEHNDNETMKRRMDGFISYNLNKLPDAFMLKYGISTLSFSTGDFTDNKSKYISTVGYQVSNPSVFEKMTDIRLIDIPDQVVVDHFQKGKSSGGYTKTLYTTQLYEVYQNKICATDPVRPIECTTTVYISINRDNIAIAKANYMANQLSTQRPPRNAADFKIYW
jgi:hypothetical protein